MGQAGSVEQRSAIRAIISIRPGDGDKQHILDALRAFSAAFPLQQDAGIEADEAGPTAVADVDVKERRLFDAVHALLQQQAERTERGSNEELMELLLLSFRRVIMWREMYRLCAKCSMKPFLNCLYLSPKLVQSALDIISCMITAPPGADAGEKTERWEIANRRNFGETGGYEVLRSLLVQYSAEDSRSADKDAILLNVMVLFHLTLVSRRATTDFLTCSQAVGALMNARISLLELCHDANAAIQDYAIDLVKELFSITDLDQVHDLQESAREYGALLYALTTALSQSRNGDGTKNGGQSTPTNSAGALQEKCIDLVEIFCAGNTRTKKAMSRVFPVELFIPEENRVDLIARHTASSTLVRAATRANRSLPHFSFDFESMSTTETKRNRDMSVANNAKNIGSGAFDKWLSDARTQGEHWRNIIESVLETHERPELVWRNAMRVELRDALRAEIDHLETARRQLDTGSGTVLRWEHEMFYVNYPSFEAELVVNGYFVEYLIPKLSNLADNFEVADPMVLAWHLSDRLSVETNQRWRVLCVRCLRLILRRYAMTFHGQLPTQNILAALADHCNASSVFLREAFQLLNTAIVTTRNAPSDKFNRLSTTLVRAVVDVLTDPAFIANLSSRRPDDSDSETEGNNEGGSDEDDSDDSDGAQIFVKNSNDAVVRTGVTLLLSITTRSKFTLLLVRSKRMFLCRLLALETLDHVTITRILSLLKKVAVLDGSRTSSFTIPAKRGAATTAMLKAPLDGNWKSLALVYVLFASCDPKGMGMCVAAAEFLKENCISRVGSSSSSEFSKLLNEALGFSGRGMGQLLETATPKAFTEVFNAHEKRAADVNWGRRQRLRLYRYLRSKYIATTTEQVQGNQRDSQSDGAVVMPETHADGVGNGEYYQDEDDIFVGNIFLRSYIEGDGEFLNEWTPEMYSNLIDALFTRLSDLGRTKSINADGTASASVGPSTLRGPYAEPWEVQVLILKALVRLIPSRCSSIDIRREYYESLLIPMKRTLLGEADQIRGILALELVLAIMAGPVAPESSSGVNVSTCVAFLSDKGLAVIGEALERMLNPSFQELLRFSARGIHNMARVLLYRVTDVVTVLTGHTAGVAAIQRNPVVVTALLELSSRHTIMTYSEDAATVCLSCVAGLCHSEALRSLVVGAGGLLFFLDISAFCPAEEAVSTTESARPEDDGVAVAGSKPELRPSRFISAVRSAALALRTCLDDKTTDEKAALPLLVLKQLLTPSFIRILRASPDRFILLLQTKEDISNSTLIWKASMRERLRECLETELAKVKTAARSKIWPRWNPEHFVAADSFRYQYPELADELILQDVYLNNFLTATDESELEDIDMSALSEALLISIQSNENVLRILEERGASDLSKEAAVRTMRDALNKLVSAHPQHNLEVGASDDQTPPITPQAAAGDLAPQLPTSSTGRAVAAASFAVASSTASLVFGAGAANGNLHAYPEEPSPRYGRESSVDIEDLTV